MIGVLIVSAIVAAAAHASGSPYPLLVDHDGFRGLRPADPSERALPPRPRAPTARLTNSPTGGRSRDAPIRGAPQTERSRSDRVGPRGPSNPHTPVRGLPTGLATQHRGQRPDAAHRLGQH